jgi:2-polyprenyl-3-methyl-5-hydroxy-6-metoxy-1,4-benzoquinol methylase
MNINEHWENEWNKRITSKVDVSCNQQKAKIIIDKIRNRNYFSPRKILDIGCGPALHALRIMQECPDYNERWFGIDLSQKAVDFFRKHGLRGECGSIYDFSPNGHKFEAFLLLDTLEHITDRDRLALKVREMIQPNSVMFGNIPLYINKKDLENGVENMMDINKLSRFCVISGFEYLDYFIYGINGYPYMIWQAANAQS